jgi:GTP-binding nuclear protein Ran
MCSGAFLTHDSRNPSLEFVAAPALAPAEVAVDMALMEKYKQELAAVSHCCHNSSSRSSVNIQAEAVPLPEEDDDL